MRIVGFENALGTRIGDPVNILAPLHREDLDPLLARLSADERTRLAAEGAALTDEEAFSLAFGDAL